MAAVASSLTRNFERPFHLPQLTALGRSMTVASRPTRDIKSFAKATIYSLDDIDDCLFTGMDGRSALL